MACKRNKKESGGGGIRTPGTREGTTVFETATFDHSVTPPLADPELNNNSILFKVNKSAILANFENIKKFFLTQLKKAAFDE